MQREKIDKMSAEVKDSNPYSRLMALQRMGVVDKYEDIKQHSLIIVGVGGVGSVAAEMLCRCGIGKLILYDYDKVELANMNRLFYRPEQSGKFKVDAARETLLDINPDVVIEAYSYNITSNENYDKFLDKIRTGGINGQNVSLVLSCVDNYAARMTINRACNGLNQLWMESGVSEDAMNGHIQFIIPGETACFACAPPLVVAEEGNEKKIKREGVCAASLPTTMAVVAGFLSQNTLKYLLNFGETSYFLSYNSFKDFFPNSILLPNPNCNDDNCVELQKKFNSGELKSRKNVRVERKEEPTVAFENDWGITIESEPEVKEEVKVNPGTVDTKNQSLEDLQSQMKNLMKKGK